MCDHWAFLNIYFVLKVWKKKKKKRSYPPLFIICFEFRSTVVKDLW